MPTEAGMYWALISAGSKDYWMIVDVQGEPPFFEVYAYNSHYQRWEQEQTPWRLSAQGIKAWGERIPYPPGVEVATK